MLFVIVLLVLIIGGGYGFIVYKKSELTEISEIAEVKEKPIMPAINTSFFLQKEKDILGMEGEKLTDYTIENMAYPNYHRGYFMKEDNLFIIVSQNLPNGLQKYLGISDEAYITVLSVFDDGSELSSTTMNSKLQMNVSSYRRLDQYDSLPLMSIIEKHKIRIDVIESKGPQAMDMDPDLFIKYVRRGVMIDKVHKSTKGYETKADMEKILEKLGLKQEEQKTDEAPAENREEEG